jgi:hypothetical protein
MGTNTLEGNLIIISVEFFLIVFLPGTMGKYFSDENYQ